MRVDSVSVRMVAGVLRRDGRILICHRRPDRASWPDVWDLRGGHVEENESNTAALVRELNAELGIQAEPPVGPAWTTLRATKIELSIYLIDRWRGEPRNAAIDEHELFTGSLAHSAGRHPWRTLVEWVVARLPVA